MQFNVKRSYLAPVLAAAVFFGGMLPSMAELTDTKPITYSVTGASVRGYYKVVVEAINGVVRDAYPGTAATFRPGSPAGALVELANGKVEIAVAGGAPEIKFAVEGKPPYKEPLRGKIMHVMMLHEEQMVHSVMTKAWADEHGIRSFDDIAEKKPKMRLAVNNLANLQATLGMHIAIFNAYGFSESDIEKWGGSLVRGNSGIGLSALADGKADVFINGRFLPDSKLVDISRNRELLWIDGNPKKIEAAAAEWGYKMVTVPKDGYPFMGGKDSPTITQWTTINSSPKVSEEIIYKFVKALYEGADRIRAVHPSLREFSGRQMVRNPMGLPIHPGAERFYREQGLL